MQQAVEIVLGIIAAVGILILGTGWGIYLVARARHYWRQRGQVRRQEPGAPRQPWSAVTIAWMLASLLAIGGVGLCATGLNDYFARRLTAGLVMLSLGTVIFVASLFIKK